MTAVPGLCTVERDGAIMTCDDFDARRAEALGLLNSVVPPDRLLPTARQLADKILTMPPLVIRMVKGTINAYAAASNLGDGTAFDVYLREYTSFDPDARTRPDTFLSRRKKPGP